MSAALVCLVLSVQTEAYAASDDDVTALIKAVQKLQVENRELARRLAALEAERSGQKPALTRAEPSQAPATRKPEPQARQQVSPTLKAPPGPDLEQRVTELETAKTAQEDSVRSIIRDSLAKTGSKINEFVTLGGAIEVTGGRTSDFTGQHKDSIQLSTAELDMEIKVNEWMLGNLIIQYDTGTNILFPTAQSFNTGVDRLTVDRATVVIGDVQRFPLYAKVGRDVLAFGTSTGVHRADVLSIENPLTIEVFETRRNSVGIGFALPTPPVAPPQSQVVPPVRPMFLNPAMNALARSLGYQPLPTRQKPLAPTPRLVEPPPFYGSLDVYDANTVDGVNRRFGSTFNGRLGYQTTGNCGRNYEDLKNSLICPWAFDVSVDYISSVFDSRFLESEYRNFMNQFGQIPGIAAEVKLSFGPMLLIAEYDTAIKTARFVDDAGRAVGITPAAWQIALGYQFDWNPWVEAIGVQGTFVALGYSRSHDLAGVTLTTTAGATRVGFVPQSRLTLTAAEWVLDGAKLSVEYAHDWDYSVAKGGSGRQADAILVGFTYTW